MVTHRLHFLGLVIVLFSLLTACAASSDSDGALKFHGETDLLDSFEYDTGFLPDDLDAQARVLVRGGSSIVAKAGGAIVGDRLTPVAESGELKFGAELTLEVSAKVDVSRINYEGVVQEIGYTIPESALTFDPFLLDGTPAVLETTLPMEELLRAPVPSVPGSTMVVTVEGGTVQTSLIGVCAQANAEFAEYAAEVSLSGEIELSVSIEIEIPVVGTKTFGPFPVTVAIPAIERPLNLGILNLASGERDDSAPSPCTAGPAGDAAVPSEGGARRDGGTVRPDSGIPGTDAGTLRRDAGTPRRDAGTPRTDASRPRTDAGGPSCEATCDGCCLGETCRLGTSAAACGTDGDRCATCGDGSCMAGMCIEPECRLSADCGRGFFCNSGDCRVNSTTRWSIYVARFRIDQRKPDGSWWDGDENNPDPYVALEYDGSTAVTNRVNNGMTGSEADPLFENVRGIDLVGSTIGIEVWDYDRDVDDLMVSTTVRITEAHLRAGQLIIDEPAAGAESSLDLTLDFR